MRGREVLLSGISFYWWRRIDRRAGGRSATD
jgi:hypothetical protein